MRQWFPAGLLVWALLPTPARAFPYPVHTRTLPNGCELVVVPMPSEGAVATAIWMDVGSRNEVEPGKTGFAHFFEHLLFSGTEKLAQEDREKELMKLGIGDNAWTWLDETVYNAVSDTESLDAWMGIQADMMQNLALTPDHVRREAGAVYGEYRKTQADPAFHLEQKVRATAFTTHPYAHDTLGYEADIAAMPGAYDYARTFYARWYQPENARVLLVGDIEPDAGFALLEKHFGGWKARPTEVPAVPVEPAQEAPRRTVVKWEGDVPPRVMIAWRVPAHDPADPELAALELAQAILLGPAGRLTNRLIREEAIALDVRGGREGTVDPGLFTIEVELKPGADPERVEAIVDEELFAIVGGVEPAFLERTRSHAKYGALVELDDPENVLYVVGSRLRRGADPKAIDAFDALVGSIDAQALAEAVSKHLREDNRTTGWLVPEARDAD